MKIKLILLTIVTLIFFISNVSAEKLSINVKETDLHDTIMMIAELGNLNVAIDDSVKGTISISFDNIEPLDSLNIIAKTKDLNIVKEDNVYIITALYATNSLMNSYILPVKYGDAEKFREALVNSLDLQKDDDDNDNLTYKTIHHRDGSFTEYHNKRNANNTQRRENEKRVAVNKDVNALILFGTATEYQRAKLLLQSLDIPLKQISIEAKVLSVDKSAIKDLGITWDWNLSDGYSFINRSSSANYSKWGYATKLNALVSNGKAKILSRPNITTVQGNEAKIEIGSKVPVATTTTTNSTITNSYNYIDAGIILKCEPQVNHDNSVKVKVYVEVSTPNYVSEVGAYSFNTRSATTIVTLKNGEPMIIGGLIGKDEENSISKIPFLGDLPILGSLFRNRHKNKSESELMIFLTANVIE